MKIIRRYNCTYNAADFLFPPLELMYLGAIIKEWKKDNCILIDAIAERLAVTKVIIRLKSYQPDLLVFMAGIESFIEDMQTIKTIKSYLPSIKIACIGYLPTVFPQNTLENNPAIDYIIMNEPELSFSEIYDIIKRNEYVRNVKGVAQRASGDNIIIGPPRDRISDLDKIPFPARTLANIGLYNEFLLKKPFTTMMTSRGCPFKCTFCISTYGKEIVHRSIENIIAEIEEVILRHKIKTIRFMDDTFILDKERIAKLCHLILERNLKFQWAALTRIGTLSDEILALMKRAGLKRLYLGIETSSQRVLNYYKKGYDADLIEGQVNLIKKNDVEAAGLFMVGDIQTEEELKKDIALARRLKLNYIAAAALTAYPGTELFTQMRDDVTLNPLPNSNTSRDIELRKKRLRSIKLFYRKFYFDPKYFISALKFLYLDPIGLIMSTKRIVQFVFYRNNNQKGRPDLI